MDILKAFSLLETEYPINIQGTPEDPLFQANQIAKLLGISNIRENLRDFDSDEKHVILTDTLGGAQNTMFLTEIGLYKILGRSRKPIAHTFQKWMINVLKEIRVNGIYKLQQEKEVDKKLFQHKCDLATHQTLLKAYHKKNVVYICKLKTIEDKFVIKIGSTQDIKERFGSISCSYTCCSPHILDIFETNHYKKFEKKIHQHPYIAQYYEHLLKKNGCTSRETYLINAPIYAEINKIIQHMLTDFLPPETKEIEELKIIQQDQQIKLAELKIQQETIRLQQLQIECEMQKNELELKKLTNQYFMNDTSQQSIPNDASDEDDKDDKDDEDNEDNVDEAPVVAAVIEPVNYIKKRNNGVTIPKVYQYNPDDLVTPINVFDSPLEVERSMTNVSHPALKRAYQKCTIYKGFRWMYVHRNETPPVKIEDTVISKCASPEIRFIAMIDIKKTKILAVYSSQKDAVEARNMKCNSFTRAIKQQHVSSGHYWNFFDECSQDMQQEYLSTNKLPDKFTSNAGTKIQQIDPLTNNVICTYNSKNEIIKKYQISHGKLAKLLHDTASINEIYNGFIWQLCPTV
jgi:prophage antirepressor-like protein